MLDRRFRKYITLEQRKKFMQVFKQKFTKKEYLIFLRKFRGSMISKGRSSFSYRMYDRIRIYFKRILKDDYGYMDPDLVLKLAFFNLIPILGTANVKRGRRVQTVPVLLKLRKRIVLMNKGLISSQKNKSNVRGIKINDVSRLIALLLFEKGNAYDQKIDNLKRVYSARHVLLKMGGRRFNKRAFRRIQNRVLEKLKLKHGVETKLEDETLTTSILTMFNLLIFLKYKKKFRKIKSIVNDLRGFLLVYGHQRRSMEKRGLILGSGINHCVKMCRTHKVNVKKLELLKPKYKLVCEHIMKKI